MSSQEGREKSFWSTWRNGARTDLSSFRIEILNYLAERQGPNGLFQYEEEAINDFVR